jgi:hypothetical protein
MDSNNLNEENKHHSYNEKDNGLKKFAMLEEEEFNH